MKYLKGFGYLLILAVTTPLLWWLGRNNDGFEGETFAEYDDDDLGDIVDDDEDEA